MGAALHGLGLSLNFMGTITILSSEEGKKGLETERMAGLMTSLWLTSESLGSFLGALAGGAAYDRCTPDPNTCFPFYPRHLFLNVHAHLSRRLGKIIFFFVIVLFSCDFGNFKLCLLK